MSLTSYQQAVLQEMGITVWVTRKAYEEQKSDSTVEQEGNGAALSQPAQTQVTERSQAKPITQEEKQSKLAQLRAQMGGGAKSETKPDKSAVKTSVSAPSNESVHSRPATPKNVPLTPEGVPLSAQQREQAALWLSDLQLACVQLGLPSTLVGSVMISTALKVDEHAIILPTAPLSLDKKQKRALWQALISFAQTR
ncbi:hypothetical protein MTsDn1_12050 [Alteromonas sp. MTD1]|uniref:alanine acetyltransferase n=1 Tax=Alteromonas sp. MTD1 TaxID=3057962 RepID=UPI0036F3C529